MKRSEDQLAIFENQLRNVGLWCDHRANVPQVHFMVARNPRSNLAISLCGYVITEIEKLHENSVSIHCLVCDLYISGGKEQRERLDRSLNRVLQEIVTKQSNYKE